MPIAIQQTRPATGWGRALAIAPLIAVPVLIYNLVALTSASAGTALAGAVFDMSMLSGARFVLTWGDLLLVLAIVFLFAEVLKATGTGATAITNHMLSMGLFIVCLLEFLLLPSFATPVFFLMTAIVLLDALAGMVVSTISARRDFGVGEGFTS
jgi:hypothetical protein